MEDKVTETTATEQREADAPVRRDPITVLKESNKPNPDNTAEQLKTVLDNLIIASTNQTFVNVITNGLKISKPDMTDEEVRTGLVICIKECYKGVMLADARLRLEQQMLEICKSIDLPYIPS